MPVPVRRIDMKAVSERMHAKPEKTDAEIEAELEQYRMAGEKRWKKWLSQFDSEGHLKPGIENTAGYVPNMSPYFLRMSEEEQAAYVLSEKKRFGVE